MLHVEFCSARSYGAKTETSGSVQISYDDSMVKGRNVLVSRRPAAHLPAPWFAQQ
jgi:hypoxanthine-guanine phosphoribosyltransferase